MWWIIDRSYKSWFIMWKYPEFLKFQRLKKLNFCLKVCKFKAHKRCASKVTKSCKWTTLASIDSSELIENEDRNLIMRHQWLEGNLPVNAKCSYCDKACGSVLHMQDFRCLWCKSYVRIIRLAIFFFSKVF